MDRARHHMVRRIAPRLVVEFSPEGLTSDVKRGPVWRKA